MYVYIYIHTYTPMICIMWRCKFQCHRGKQYVCCIVSLCVAVCCSVLQCLQCVAVCCRFQCLKGKRYLWEAKCTGWRRPVGCRNL